MSIFNMFGRSPLGPLQTHMGIVNQCVQLLTPFFEATFLGEWKKAGELQAKISQLEHDADELKRGLRLNLPDNFLLPVSRIDLLQLLSTQDSVANKAKDIAGLVFGRKMVIPNTMSYPFKEYVQSALDTASQANKAIHELDKLLETSFRGIEAEFVQTLIGELHGLEHKSDQLQVEVRQLLFGLEKEIAPVDVIFLYKIIDYVGDLADRADSVGGRLQMLLAR